MRASLKCGLFMVLFNFFMFAYLSLPYLIPPVSSAGLAMNIGKEGAGFLFMIIVFMIAALIVTILLHYGCCAVRKKIFHKPTIGEIFVATGLITPEELTAALATGQLRIGEILMDKVLMAEGRKDPAPARAQNNYVNMGEMLVQIGFSADDEIRWALSQKKKRLEKILKEKTYSSRPAGQALCR